MRCSPLSRFTGIVLAALVSLSAPGLGLAHGYAHHEARERADNGREHHHGVSESTPSGSGEFTAWVDGTGRTDDHGHPELSVARSARADLPLFVVAANIALSEPVVVESQASLLLTAAPARAGPPHAPPRQPRAPPLG